MSGTETDAPEKPKKAGGQALADGVFMRTEKAWAIARADGSVEVGAIGPTPFSKVPVLRVIAGMGKAIALGIGKGVLGPMKKDKVAGEGKGGGARGNGGTGSRRGRAWRRRPATGGPEKTAGEKAGEKANKRFLWVMLALQVGTIPVALLMDPSTLPVWGYAGFTLVVWTVLLTVMRAASPSALWRYHGAEHKAVAALEAGIDLDDIDAVMTCPRVHNRCGSNLVFLMAALSCIPLDVPAPVQALVFVFGFASIVEILGLASKKPDWIVTRFLLGGGRWLQKVLTTVEPTREEQIVGCRALQACLEEEARLVAEEKLAKLADTGIPAMAAA